MGQLRERRKVLDLIKHLDVPVEESKEEFDPEIDLTLTLGIPSCGEVAKASAMSDGDLGEPESKRCSSCGILDTPAWRKGPDGPKTLCNSCGLRHLRSGRKTSKKRKAPRSKREQREAQALALEEELMLSLHVARRLRTKRTSTSP